MAGRESELLATVAQLTQSNSELQQKVNQTSEECDTLKNASSDLKSTQETLSILQTKLTNLGNVSDYFQKIRSYFNPTVSIDREHKLQGFLESAK